MLIMCLGFIVSAQTTIGYVDKGNTYASVATDYTLTNAVANSYIFSGKQDYKATQDFLVNLDSLAGNHTNVEVALYGRKFATSAWAAIGSAVDWAGTTSDTTIVISNTTATRYRDYKIVYTGTGTGTTTIDLQQLKLWLE